MFPPAKLSRALIAVGLFAGAPVVLAQNAANPIFQGYQPDLITGAQDGLATGKPKIRHLYLADPLTLAIVVDAQAIPILPYVKYEPQAGDEIKPRNLVKLGEAEREAPRYKSLIRGGKDVGDILGPKDAYFIPKLRLEGESLNLVAAEAPASYAVSSTDDAAYGTAQAPTAIFRKTFTEMKEWVATGGEARTARHTLFLRLARPLTTGKHYQVEFPGVKQFSGPVAFTFDDSRLRSEAVHVNLLGYHPAQQYKKALLSMWLGSGGDANLSGLKRFAVVDDKTGRSVLEGDIKLQKAAVPNKKTAALPNKEPAPLDLPATVYELDFSALNTPGVYRVVVPGLGSSFSFRVDAKVWEEAARISMLGFFNQRAGMALTKPYTDFVRPRSLHPDDGFVVHRTDPVRFNDEKKFPGKSGNAFKRIQFAILEDTQVPKAWGGWHDAADFDRSILPQCHMDAVHAMLDLYESNPDYFAKLNLNIPESGNQIPDIVDEALWCMDLFQRIQEPDGSVPSAIESIEHPSAAPSFLETLPTAITPSTPQTCLIYAAAAAHSASVLQKFDPARAKALQESAIRAVAWADNNPTVPNIYDRDDQRPAKEHATLAAAELYKLTGEEKWHDRFKSTLKALYPQGIAKVSSMFMAGRYSGPRGIVTYALMPADKVDPALQADCKRLLVAAGDQVLEKSVDWPMGINAATDGWGGRGDNPIELVNAHRVTGDAKYVAALVRLSQPSMGANPNNASHTWGLGARHVVTFQIDPNRMGTPFPVGITTYGPFPRNVCGGAGLEKALGSTLYPPFENWPSVESLFNLREASATEYAIASLSQPLLARAYLAQVFSKPSAVVGQDAATAQ